MRAILLEVLQKVQFANAIAPESRLLTIMFPSQVVGNSDQTNKTHWCTGAESAKFCDYLCTAVDEAALDVSPKRYLGIGGLKKIPRVVLPLTLALKKTHKYIIQHNCKLIRSASTPPPGWLREQQTRSSPRMHLRGAPKPQGGPSGHT